jgi:hypothetical protein
MVYKDVCLKGLPDEGLDNCLSLKERATLVRNYVGLDKRSRLDVTLVLRSLRLLSMATRTISRAQAVLRPALERFRDKAKRYELFECYAL